MNLIGYLRLGCRAQIGKKVMGGRRERRNRIITPFLHHANIPHSEVLHHEMETSRQGTALILRLQPRYTHQGGNDTTTAVKQARVGE